MPPVQLLLSPVDSKSLARPHLRRVKARPLCFARLRGTGRFLVVDVHQGIETVFEGVENLRSRYLPPFVIYEKAAALWQLDLL